MNSLAKALLLQHDARTLSDLANRAMTMAHYLESARKIMPEAKKAHKYTKKAAKLLAKAAQALGAELRKIGPVPKCVGCD